MRSLLLSLALLAACGPDVNVTPHKVDKDGDGYAEDIDCDDTHATVNPDADEVCDGADNNCDGAVDDDASDAATWYADADGDGFGDESAPTLACEAPAGAVADATDCDDAVASVYPGADEVCDDLDNDCDGAIDDDPVDLATFYVDVDGDGYGDPATAIQACEPGTGEVADGTDCDDGDAAIHPDAVEDDCADPTDYNCDGSVGYVDADGDGAPACADCDDADNARSPSLAEVCDELDVDEDCDGLSDDGDDSVTGLAPFGRDVDGDGYYAGATVEQCEAPEGYASVSGDCDDYDSGANPGAPEICDALDTDEDCDGLVDDADASVDASTWSTFYADRDGDTYGDASRTATQCESPSNYVTDDTDCDDTNAARNPGETEVCDAADLDEDCDSLADDDDSGVTGTSTYYADADGDGYGGDTTTDACSMPSGYVANATDCDDTSASVSPAATEACDTADTDEDCDGLADDADSAASGKSTWYRDADSDGYAGSSSTSACDQPSGYLATATDCNDGNGSISPAATEVCDSANTDEDCDSLADDLDASATGETTWYRDADGDGYAGSTTTTACDQPSGYLSTSTDCDDASAAISPAAAEVCDTANTDEDCDGFADDYDSGVTGKSTWYRDADSDTYGNASVSASTCDLPSGYVANDDDCDDASASVTNYRTWYQDADSDGYGGTTTASSCAAPSGYVAASGDCDDASASVSPGDTEVCDSGNTDEDCDGYADDDDSGATGTSTWYLDADGDRYGDASISASACDTLSGYVTNADDCDDASASVSPAAAEVCDASDTDEDCDGLADDDDSGATGTSTWYLDADGDGYGSTTSVSACDAPSTYVSDATDCDDAEGDSYPGNAEVCDDGIDQDCSGVDEGCRYSGSYAVDSGYDTKIYGVSSGDRFGDQLVAGDFNGDGAGDLVVAAIDNQYSTQKGTVYGYYGPFPAGAASATTNDDFLWYNTNSDYASLYGGRLYNLGDVNGDGNDDLLVSLNHSTTWLTYLYLGGDTGTVPYTTERDATLGCSSAAAAGDFDATSGNDEWICGYSASNTYTGVAYIFAGTSTTATATFTGEDTYDYVGKSVAGGGDVDGDGYDDVWIGAYMDDTTATEAGAVYLVYGPVSGTMSLASADAKIQGDAYQDYLGNNMTMPGDVDGDGLDDLVATAHLNDVAATNAGAIYVFTNPTTGTAASQAHAIIRGEDASDQLGWNASTGDFDGDGEIDLLVGSHFNDDSATDAGSTWVVYGPLSGTSTLASADAEWLGTNTVDYFGYRYAVVPDTDGDGRDELAMAANAGDHGSGSNYGAVWIWLGE